MMTLHERKIAAPIDPVKLDRLAVVAVKIGLRLQPGQDLLLTAPIVALPLVRKIAEHAYKAGAGLVTPFFSDDEITLSRYRFGSNESFDRAAGWLYEGMSKAFAGNTARLAIVGDNPMLLSGQDPAKVACASKANSIAYQPALEKDRRLRHQLEHHRLSQCVLGEAGFSRRQRGYRRDQACRCHICSIPGRQGGRCRSMGKSQR
jgi:aminopeptidase